MQVIHVIGPVLGLLIGASALAATPNDATTSAPAPTTKHHHLFKATPAAPAPSGTAAATNSGTTTKPTVATGAGKFASEAEAAQGCGGSTNVVWANTGTKAYHVAGDKYFGHTKHGAFMCKAAADAGGYHLSGTHRG